MQDGLTFREESFRKDLAMMRVPRHWNALFLAVLLGLCMFCTAEEIRVGTGDNCAWIDTGTANSCRVTVREKWSRFAVFDLGEIDKPTHFIIRQDFEVGEGCFEGHNPESVKLSAFPLDILSGKVGEKPVWQLETVGVDGHFRGNDFYGVEAPGCCDSQDTTLYYSLRTGKLAGASTNRPLDIGIPNTSFWRFITTQSDLASERKGIKDANINIFYASKDGLMQSVGIILPEKLAEGSRVYQWSFLGKGKECTRCDLFGAKTIAGAAVVLESNIVSSFSITLPFGDDGFDISKASMEGVEAKLLTESYPDAAPDENE